ncbi:MAG: DUF58 domain-containing protein [Spirochaetia bacterium]|nr:DUF58 domain-containing protein [Spirochaetia bacterium]
MDHSYRIGRKLKNLSLFSRKVTEGVLSGNYRTAFKGVGLEFDEVREYVPGDDVRNIDWNVTSRMNVPYSKKFREERELNVYFLIDVSLSVDSGIGKVSRRELAGQIAALLAYSAVMNNDRIGAAFFSDRIEKWIPAMRGRNSVPHLVNNLLQLKPAGTGSDLSAAVRIAYKEMKRKGVVVIISDFKYQSGWKELTLLSRKHDVIAVRLADPSDYRIPGNGTVEYRDAESGKTVVICNVNRRVQDEYREFWKNQFYFWEEICARRKIQVVTVSTDEDPVAKLMSVFGESGKR